MVIVLFFLFGIVLGSFLNVCITRIPEEMSIVSPGSHCPRCKTPIKPYDNIPVIAWLWLKGKCRNCGLPISPMYPVVELTTGLLFVWAYVDFGLSQATAKWLFFTCLVLILTVTDLRVRMLPDVVNWPGVAAGLAFSSVVPPADYTAFVLSFRLFHRPLPFRALGLLDGILGALFGSLLLWGLAAAYRLVRGREGMGMGDVKMMAMAGAFLGLRATFLVILLGSLLGSFVGLGTVLALYAAGWKSDLAERASRRGLGTVRSLRWLLASQYQLPLGTFLGVAALVVVYVSPWAAAHWEWIPRII